MANFKITYKDPETNEIKHVVAEFNDWVGRVGQDGAEIGPPLSIPAMSWARDYAYTLADKGWYEVKKA